MARAWRVARRSRGPRVVNWGQVTVEEEIRAHDAGSFLAGAADHPPGRCHTRLIGIGAVT
jgi:hypothetical protein